MSRNPGQTITIYNIAEIFGIAFENCMTTKNIKSGFSKTAIFSFNPTIFDEEGFMCCEVKNRPYVQLASEKLASNIEYVAKLPLSNNENDIAKYLKVVANKNDINVISAEDCIGLSKAKPCKTTSGRKKGKSCFLTNTPEMKRIQDEAKARKNRSNGKMDSKKSLFGSPKAKKIKKKARKVI